MSLPSPSPRAAGGEVRRSGAHFARMRRTMPPPTGLTAAILLLVPLVAFSLAARAQDFTVNGLVDLGFAKPSEQTSWLKGGLGKLDSGGSGERSPAFVGQALADLRLQLDPPLGAFLRLRAAPHQPVPPGIPEAHGRHQPVTKPDWL